MITIYFIYARTNTLTSENEALTKLINIQKVILLLALEQISIFLKFKLLDSEYQIKRAE